MNNTKSIVTEALVNSSFNHLIFKKPILNQFQNLVQIQQFSQTVAIFTKAYQIFKPTFNLESGILSYHRCGLIVIMIVGSVSKPVKVFLDNYFTDVNRVVKIASCVALIAYGNPIFGGITFSFAVINYFESKDKIHPIAQKALNGFVYPCLHVAAFIYGGWADKAISVAGGLILANKLHNERYTPEKEMDTTDDYYASVKHQSAPCSFVEELPLEAIQINGNYLQCRSPKRNSPLALLQAQREALFMKQIFPSQFTSKIDEQKIRITQGQRLGFAPEQKEVDISLLDVINYGMVLPNFTQQAEAYLTNPAFVIASLALAMRKKDMELDAWAEKYEDLFSQLHSLPTFNDAVADLKDSYPEAYSKVFSALVKEGVITTS